MEAFSLCNLFRGFPYIFCMGWMQEFTFLSYHAVSANLFFCKNYKLCEFFLAVAFILCSEAPKLKLLLLPCLLGLPDDFHVHIITL